MNRARSGSTLLLALWALLLLSAVVFAWLAALDRGIGAASAANRRMEARAMSHSGVTAALHPEIGPGSPHLHARWERRQAYDVTIRSEGARLNLNYLLAGGDPVKIALLKDYLALRGMSLPQREAFATNLRDWVAPRGARRLNGWPEGAGGPPPHRPLQSLEEIPLIAGSAPLVSQPGWKDDLTLSSSGPLDIESAPAELLALVPGIGPQRAERFARLREERTRLRGNRLPFENVAEALAALGLSPEAFGELSGILDFRDPVVRVQSIGTSADAMQRAEAVVRKAPGTQPRLLLWIEN
ncbi:MAG: hypothetical protein WCH57_06075 [Verrucomicrobiota bacterium]